MSRAGLSATFSYDAFGRRTGKTVNSAATRFLYNGADAAQEQNASGTATANVMTGGVDQVFQRTDANGTRSFLHDGLGSTLSLLDANGATTTSYTYDPFGNTTQTGATSNNPSKYTGREDDATGLYYYRARYYSPALQRFISEDPIGFAGGDVNLYAYVGNDPINHTDSSGMWIDTAIDVVSLGFSIHALVTSGRKDNTDLWLDVAGDAAGLLLPGIAGVGMARRAARRGADAGGAIKCALSFVAGTPVQTEDGVRPIEEIKEGDKVLSWNAETNQTEYKAVTAVFTRQAETILDVRIANNENGETLGVTPEHPFYVRVHKARDNLSSGDDDEGEWRNAEQLQAGDLVRRPSGEWVAVLEIEERIGGERVYNFEVEGNHNYYVGDVGVLVHNSCAAGNLPPLKGKSVTNIENSLSNGGFSKTHTTSSGNQTWKHSDGSEVLIHPYGNQNLSPYKSANNGHCHKIDPSGNKLSDRGSQTVPPNSGAAHIGIPNPPNLPTFRGRPHGSGVY